MFISQCGVGKIRPKKFPSCVMSNSELNKDEYRVQ